MTQPSLFELPVPEGYRLGEPALSIGDGNATAQFIVKPSQFIATDDGWSGVCACGKSARDGIRCKLGATHATR